MPLYFSLTVENGIIEIIGISDKKDEINNFLHISIDWAELSNFTYTGIRKEKKCWNGLRKEFFRNGRIVVFKDLKKVGTAEKV